MNIYIYGMNIYSFCTKKRRITYEIHVILRELRKLNLCFRIIDLTVRIVRLHNV